MVSARGKDSRPRACLAVSLVSADRRPPPSRRFTARHLPRKQGRKRNAALISSPVYGGGGPRGRWGPFLQPQNKSPCLTFGVTGLGAGLPFAVACASPSAKVSVSASPDLMSAARRFNAVAPLTRANP